MITIDPQFQPILITAAVALTLALLIVLWQRLHYRKQLAQLSEQLQAQAINEAKLQDQLNAAQESKANLHNQLTAQQQELGQTRDDKYRLQAAQQASEVTIQNLESQLATARQERLDSQHKQETQQATIVELQQANTRVSAELAAREQNLKEQLALFEQQKHDFSQRFQVLAQEILEQKTQTLQKNNQESLSKVINPFQVSLNEFKDQVNNIHRSELSQRAELKRELHQLKELNQQLSGEAQQLSTALRGQKKLQGNWGELVLENVLERSGLQAGKDYQREVSFTTEDGRQRPDAIVYLPQNKHLIIDAKVSLNAYTNYVNSEDETQRQAALSEHAQAMRARINELAARKYDEIAELNSPEVVFMFVPIESAFVEALKADESLFQTAIEQNILVATPTTLLTSLNIVRQLWRFEEQGKHTAALADKADKVFQKLNNFLKTFDQIKKSLDKAQESYTKAENQLVSGRGNLVKQVSEFKQLAPAIKGELPPQFEEKAALEVDFTKEDPTEIEQ